MTLWYMLLVLLPVAMTSGEMIWNSKTTMKLESIVPNNPLAKAILESLEDQDREFGPVDIEALDNILKVVEISNDYCTRRKHMAMTAGLINGYTLEGVQQPYFLAESTKIVKAGSDTGALVFVPSRITICAGDSITWIDNMGGPHNVVFDYDDVPAGVDAEAISTDSQLGGEGFTMKFDKAGTYEYYCEPHRGAGMMGTIVVS